MIDVFIKTNTPISDIPTALSGFDSKRVQVRNGGATEVWERSDQGWSKDQSGFTLFNQLCPDLFELVAYSAVFGGGYSELIGDGMVLSFANEEAGSLLAYLERYQYQLEDAIGCSINAAGRSCALACFPLGTFKAMVDKEASWGGKVVDWVINVQKAGADEVGLVISHVQNER